MKYLIITVTLFAAACCFGVSSGASIRVRRAGLIPGEFRNIKIEDYLKNQRAVAFQLKCIVYDGPCDRIGKYLKVTIPELITGTCSQCTPSDRMIAGKLVSHIQKNFPKEWHDAVKKFQGGQTVKPEDASRLEALLGVKIEEDLVAATAASAPVAPVAAAVESAAPVVAAQPAAPLVAAAAPQPAAPAVAAAQPQSAAPVAAAAQPAAPVAAAAQPAAAPVVAAQAAAPVPVVPAVAEPVKTEQVIPAVQAAPAVAAAPSFFGLAPQFAAGPTIFASPAQF